MLTHCLSLSERRACRLVGLSRDAWRNPPKEDEATRALSAKIASIAMERRRFGYRRVHDLLRVEYPGINHKRIYRLYREQGLSVRRRGRRRKLVGARTTLEATKRLNEVWSMDFVFDQLASGRRFKCLTVADDFSHESVVLAVDFAMPAQYVTRTLDQAARFRGYPDAVRTDNGPEFTSRAFIAWAQAKGIRHILTQPGRPMQNGYIESFNGKFRDECLNEHYFESLAEAREIIAAWRDDYNQVRPHSALGRIPPAQFAVASRQAAARGDTRGDTASPTMKN